MNKKGNHQHIYDLCKDHMHAYVLAEMVDGSHVDGIITGLDNEYVYFAVPMEQESRSSYPVEQHISYMYDHDMRQYWGGYPGPGYGGPGYGYGPGLGYGYGNFPPRRFRRLVLPLAALTALSILPWY